MNIDIAIKALLEFWKNQEIVSVGNTLDKTLHFEFSRSIRLPEDFRRLYELTNGMMNLYPNEFDKEGFLFYPLRELTSLEEEFNLTRENPDEYCLLFAEFMHKSWWYGVRFSKFEEGYEIGAIPTPDQFKVITRSLAEFIQLYMNDAPVLYDH